MSCPGHCLCAFIREIRMNLQVSGTSVWCISVHLDRKLIPCIRTVVVLGHLDSVGEEYLESCDYLHCGCIAIEKSGNSEAM